MGSHLYIFHPEGVAMRLLPIILSLINFYVVLGQKDSCCKIKTVTGKGPLAGTYMLSKDDPSGRPDECMDKCVYERKGDSSYYCFKKGGGMMTQCGAGGDGGDSIEKTTAIPPTGQVGGGNGGGGGGGGAVSNKKYCDLNKEHTMCKYPGPSDKCKAATSGRDFTDAGKKIILEKHNELRRKVAKGEENQAKQQPKAANMREMVWNDELAAIAQRWADQCDFGHDKDRKKLDGTYVGQNAYKSSSSRESDLTTVMSKMDKPTLAWYDEVHKYNFDPVNIKPFNFVYQAGHYTQVVWAESEELGCGQVMYKDGDWYSNIVICNYAKGGNFKGATMYEEGEPCSKCPSGYSCKDSLCAKNPVS